jgi:hypothetical protein
MPGPQINNEILCSPHLEAHVDEVPALEYILLSLILNTPYKKLALSSPLTSKPMLTRSLRLSAACVQVMAMILASFTSR